MPRVGPFIRLGAGILSVNEGSVSGVGATGQRDIPFVVRARDGARCGAFRTGTIVSTAKA